MGLLQKVIVVLVGLVMSVIGALSPDQLVASQTQDPFSQLGANVAESTLATIRAADGQAFARVPVLWVEVDGRRVTEDAWGSGGVDELRFKVGVKGVDGVAMRAGESDVALRPTDVVTVRMFRGDFSYRGVGTALATIQLQGTVKTTTLQEGAITNRVRTETSGFDLDGKARPSDAPPEDGKVAYVVLTTGQRVDTVAVEDGGGRFYTEDAAVAADAKGEPGNLLAKFVKIDGKLVREYTWGEGTLSRIEFEPAEGASSSVVVAFNDEPAEVLAGERVVITDFVGEYLIYQVAGGMMRVRLDGYAGDSTTATAGSPLPARLGPGEPVANFTFRPFSPKTTDTVQFTDDSNDDGVIVFYQWDFGDNSSSVLPDPTHRFAKPGDYEVRLNVTDNDLQTSSYTRIVRVRNAEPIPDFDFAPKVVTTDTVVAFTDQSYDADGMIVNWTWDFGDGSTSYTRHPTHRFARGGNVTVTLTTVDELGARASLSKVVIVRNNPPVAGFAYAPQQPATLEEIRFTTQSTDSDGRIVSWNWSFGDGTFASGSNVSHAYGRPGLYQVALTVVDDAGDADTVSTQVLVRNRAPIADFDWSPKGAPASTPVTFTSTSVDPDGVILVTSWLFGDGAGQTFGAVATHTFPRAGKYSVTVTVTDATLMTSNFTREITIANGAPTASFTAGPNPSFRGVPVTFTDVSRDPDGDAITARSWDLAGMASSVQPTWSYTFNQTGSFPITLMVQDANGQTATATQTIRVVNRPPLVAANADPAGQALAGEPVYFNATGVDPDGDSSQLVYRWDFGDGTTGLGQNVTHTYERGVYTASVRAQDPEGGVSGVSVTRLNVDYAVPRAQFSYTPETPQLGRQVNFTDLSTSANGAIREWRWSFRDGGTSDRPNPTHVFTRSGIHLVGLEVRDVRNRSSFVEKAILVNTPPEARFSLAPSGIVPLHGAVDFTDQSVDPDGNVTQWFWDFGDGTNSTARHPSHVYDTPGAYPVRLTVTDEYGATHTSDAKIINVANTPPLARWRSDAGGLRDAVGVPILFIGGESSTDPDGTPLTAFTWNFGDATGPVSGANVTHRFTSSGRYNVGLVVSDGIQSSPRDALSHRIVRIEPDHPIPLRVEGVLPNGLPANLMGADYALEAVLNTADGPRGNYTRSDFVANGDGVDLTIPSSLWVRGDVLTVTLRATFLSAPQSQTIILRDDTGVDGPLLVRFNVRVPVLADVVAQDAAEATPLDEVLGADDSYGSDPLYTSMVEKLHGTGNLTYADGSIARNTDVDIEVRWVPLRTLSGLRNSTAVPSSSSIVNWCVAASARSDATGAFSWALDGTSPCYLNGGLGAYPAGRWEIRARPQSMVTENRLSDVAAIYVDPTGGLLLSAALGFA